MHAPPRAGLMLLVVAVFAVVPASALACNQRDHHHGDRYPVAQGTPPVGPPVSPPPKPVPQPSPAPAPSATQPQPGPVTSSSSSSAATASPVVTIVQNVVNVIQVTVVAPAPKAAAKHKKKPMHLPPQEEAGEESAEAQEAAREAHARRHAVRRLDPAHLGSRLMTGQKPYEPPRIIDLTEAQAAALERMNPRTKVVAARGRLIFLRTHRNRLKALRADGTAVPVPMVPGRQDGR